MRENSIKQGLSSPEILKLLNARGYNYAMIARALPCHCTLVSQVANRKLKSFRVAEAIAKAANKSVEYIFADVPEYTENLRPPTRAERLAKEQELQQLLAS